MAGTGKIDWTQYVTALSILIKEEEGDIENNYKESFRVFYKNEKGLIPKDEMEFVLSQATPSQVK